MIYSFHPSGISSLFQLELISLWVSPQINKFMGLTTN